MYRLVGFMPQDENGENGEPVTYELEADPSAIRELIEAGEKAQRWFEDHSALIGNTEIPVALRSALNKVKGE